MSTAERFKAMIDRNIRHYGDNATCTLTRFHSLENGGDGQPISTLAVNGTTALGAASIDLDSPNLEGILPAGVTFTIAGDATTYTVQADVTAASGVLSGVSILPVLASEAADDAAVTLAASVAYTASCGVLSPIETDQDQRLVHQDNRIVWISAVDLTVTPRDSDELTVQGEKKQIVLIRAAQPGDTAAGWRLEVGAL